MSDPLPRTDRLCIPRKAHRCRLCDGRINIGEPCELWTGFSCDGPFTSHAHPECMALTVGWSEADWELSEPGDVERPGRPETP